MRYLAYHASLDTAIRAETLVELIDEICTFGVDAEGRPYYQLRGCTPAPFHAYTSEWAPDEIRHDRARTIAGRLTPGNPWVLYVLA